MNITKTASLKRVTRIEPAGAVDESGEQLWIDADTFGVTWAEFFGDEALPEPQFLVNTVKAWNATYDDGTPVPITLEGIGQLPRQAVRQLVRWVATGISDPKG